MANYNAASMGNSGASWEANGYCGRGNVEGLINSLRGRTAVVVGSAYGVFDELESVLSAEPVIFAVNDVGAYLPDLDHWVSLHTDNLKAWADVRFNHRGGEPESGMKVHSTHEDTKHGKKIDYIWELLTPTFALSGYFAMQIAHIMGAERIILCGCPGDRTRRFFESKPRMADFGYGGGGMYRDSAIFKQLDEEMKRVPEFKEKVRSTSGATKQYFGGL